MTITVVIASYNYGHLAAHAVESVLAQTRQPEKILLVDDGAHDVRGFEKLYPIDILLRTDNLGVVANFNDILFNRVETDRVLFLGADNWLDEETLDWLACHDEDIVSYDWKVVGEGRKAFPAVEKPLHGSSLYNVALARQVGGYGASGGVHSEEDSVLFQKMIAAGARRFHVPLPLLYYRRHRHNGNKP